MSKDIIAQRIIEVLNDLEEEHELESVEKDKIATMVSSIARSSLDTRLFFYTEVSRIMQEVFKRLTRKRNELLNELVGKKKKTSVMN